MFKGLKHRLFVHKTASTEFQQRLREVRRRLGINILDAAVEIEPSINFMEEIEQPFVYVMHVSNQIFRKLVELNQPDEVCVVNSRMQDIGTSGKLYLVPDPDIRVATTGYIIANGVLGVLDGLPYDPVEVKQEGALVRRYIKYVRRSVS